MPNQHTTDTRARVTKALRGLKRGRTVAELCERLSLSRGAVHGCLYAMREEGVAAAKLELSDTRRHWRQRWTLVA